MKPVEQPISSLCPNRRVILAALGGAAVLPAALAACGSSGSSGGSDASHAGHSEGAAAGAGTSAAPAGTTVPVADVPVGGAVLVGGSTPVLVAQPTAGKFEAHSAICTHQGGHLGAPQGTKSTCPLHGSVFNAETGAVERGPAAKPLPAVPVTRSGDVLHVG